MNMCSKYFCLGILQITFQVESAKQLGSMSCFLYKESNSRCSYSALRGDTSGSKKIGLLSLVIHSGDYMERRSRTLVVDLAKLTILACIDAWAISCMINIQPRRASTTKVARTDAFSAGSDDNS